MSASRIFTLVFLFLIGVPMAHAVEMTDGSDPEKVAGIVSGFGSATIGTRNNGEPRIYGRIEGYKYSLDFYDCDEEEKNCGSVLFISSWENPGNVDINNTNLWNQKKRFGRAYIDTDNGVVIEMSVNLRYGVSVRNFDDTVDWWRVTVRDFVKMVINGEDDSGTATGEANNTSENL